MALEKKQSPYAVDEDALYGRFHSERPAYAGTYDNELTDLYDRISTRPGFQYDAASDPLYQNVRDEYIQGGKLAMKDTMGQAAALTGGYGSTYGQQVGQQAYDAYLQKLSDAVPELYGLAYDKWSDEGNRLLQQYSMLGDMRDTEYNLWRSELADWENERAYQTQLENEEYNRRTAEENTAYSRGQQAYANLYSLILSTGYNPTDAELSAAGMSRGAADALRGEYTRQTTPAATGGGSGGGGGRSGSGYQSGANIAEIQRQLNAMGENLVVDGILGPKTQAAMARHGITLNGSMGSTAAAGTTGTTSGGGLTFNSQREFDAYLKQLVANETITMREATDLRDEFSRSVVK